MANLYRFRVEKITNNIITQKVHFVESDNYFEGEKMLFKLYDLIEDSNIVDIVSVERIADNIIHNRELKNKY